MYSFQIEFQQYKQTNPTLENIQAVFVSGICIVSKNDKFGKFYFAKCVKNVSGRFKHVAGSERYPTLYPQTKSVVLTIKGFKKYPVLAVNEYQSHIQIKNICVEQ